MLGWLATGALFLYATAVVRAYRHADLSRSAYSSPEEAADELRELAASYPDGCKLETFGRSREGRALELLRIGGCASGARSGRFLVTGHLHANEYVGGHVARGVARSLLESASKDAAIAELLSDCEVVVAPLLNPDGAERIWRSGGWSRFGGARFTAGAVDPNRNFPFEDISGSRAWNSSRTRPGTAYYRGSHPLSEPECRALAELCAREEFAAAINFHSFGGVIYQPELSGLFAVDAGDVSERALDVFKGEFQSKQAMLRYRPVPEKPTAIQGQLDAFLLGAFGTASVTVEVSRQPFAVLAPSRAFNLFWLSNPVDPQQWSANDVPAAVHALCALREATGGQRGPVFQPGLADFVASPASKPSTPG